MALGVAAFLTRGAMIRAYTGLAAMGVAPGFRQPWARAAELALDLGLGEVRQSWMEAYVTNGVNQAEDDASDLLISKNTKSSIVGGTLFSFPIP